MNQPVTSQSGRPKWAVLFYMAGANDLANSMNAGLEKLEASQPPANLDVFVQSYTPDGKAKRYRPGHLGEAVSVAGNSGDEKSLSDFVAQARSETSAEHMLLVVGGHGEGHKGVALDDVHKDRLTLSELEGALAQSPVDAVLFDSCLMGSLEVADRLRGEAGVIIASEDVVRSGTSLMDYLEVVSQSDDGSHFGRLMVAHRPSGFSTITATDTAALGSLEQPMTEFCRGLLSLQPEQFQTLHERNRRGLEARGNLLMGWMTFPGGRLDLGDLCHDVLDSDFADECLKDSARKLGGVLGAATLGHAGSKNDGSTGFTISLPLYTDGAPQEPDPLWTRTGWDKVMERFQKVDQEKAAGPTLMELMRQGFAKP